MPSLWAQEDKYVDNRERDVYNPTTTQFTTQANVKHHLGGYRAIADDLNIHQIHRFTLVQGHGNMLQNLANHGTAVKPIFYTMPETIGFSSGFHVYDPYFRSPHQFRYYDTKSPYTKFDVTLAHFFKDFTDSNGDICYSRNITPYWNIGSNLRILRTGKGRLATSSEANNVRSDVLDIFTHYKTEDDRYQVLAHMLAGNHRVQETGGIVPEREAKEILNHPIDVNARLQEGEESSDTLRRFHLYQQLKFTEQLWGYHELSAQKVDNFFGIPAPPAYRNDNNKQCEPRGPTNQAWSAYNEIGLKGDSKDLFGSGYYRHKYIKLKQSGLHDKRHEHYMGLRARYYLKTLTDFFYFNSTHLLHDGRHLLPGLHKTSIGYQGSIFEASCERASYQPSFLAQYFLEDDTPQSRQFVPPTATQVQGSIRLEKYGIYLKPRIGFTRVEKHIYFGKDKTPKQDAHYANLVKGGTDFCFPLGKSFYWDGELTAAQTLGPGAAIFRIPAYLLNTRLYYAHSNEEGNGMVECGADMHWKSSHHADAYESSIQQFHLQDDFEVYSYPILDLFVNFRIKHLSMFFKFSHWNEHFYLPGYFATPYYPGPSKAFDIGVKWHFFD